MTRKLFLGTLLRKGLFCNRPVVMILALLAGLALALPVTTHADTYTYTGSALGVDPSFPTSTAGLTNVSGYFTVSGALPGGQTDDDITSLITSFSFSDGLQTITSASTLTAEDFVVNTNGSGQIIDWAIDLVTASGSILSCWDVPQVDPYPSSGSYMADCEPGTGFGGSGDEVQTAGEVGLVVPGSGSWSTPEPSALPMLGGGLLGLIGLAVRRKRSALP